MGRPKATRRAPVTRPARPRPDHLGARAAFPGDLRGLANHCKGGALSTYDTTTSAQGSQSGNGGAQEKAQEKAQEATQVAQEKAQQAKGAASSRVRTEVDTRSTQAGEQVQSAAQDARSVGEHLRSQGKDKPAELADKAAERAEQMGDYLKRSDGDTILGDVERVARDKPWAVMAGGLALGVAASRFLKASSSRRYHELESSSNLPARRTDVDRGALGTGAGTYGTPGTPPTAPVAPGVTSPVPGAPERELSLSGGVMPERPETPGATPGATPDATPGAPSAGTRTGA